MQSQHSKGVACSAEKFPEMLLGTTQSTLLQRVSFRLERILQTISQIQLHAQSKGPRSMSEQEIVLCKVMSLTPAAEDLVLASSSILMRFRSRVTAGIEALAPDTAALSEPAVAAAAAALMSNAWSLWGP